MKSQTISSNFTNLLISQSVFIGICNRYIIFGAVTSIRFVRFVINYVPEWYLMFTVTEHVQNSIIHIQLSLSLKASIADNIGCEHNPAFIGQMCFPAEERGRLGIK